MTAFAVGDRVVVVDGGKKFPGVWTVAKKMKVNLELTQPGRTRLRAHPECLRLAAPHEVADGGVVEFPIPPHFDLGEVVRFKNHEGYFVVLQSPNAEGRCRVAQLGGDKGRYWRVTSHSLTRVHGTFLEGAL